MKIPKPATTAIICGVSVVILLGGYAAIRGAMDAAMSSSGNPVTITVYQTPTNQPTPTDSPSPTDLATPATTATPDVTTPTPTQPPIKLTVTYWARPSTGEPGPQDLTAEQAAQVVAHDAQDVFGVDATGSDVSMVFNASTSTGYQIGADGNRTPAPFGTGNPTSLGQGETITYQWSVVLLAPTWSASFITKSGHAITAKINSVTGQLYSMTNNDPGPTWTCDAKQNASSSNAAQQAASDFVTTKLGPPSVTMTSTKCTTKSGSQKVLVTLADDSVYLVSMNAKHVVYAFEYFSSASIVDYSD